MEAFSNIGVNCFFSMETISVAAAAKRLHISRDTVIRYIEAGTLRGYRLTARGWWQVTKQSVEALERSIREQVEALTPIP